MCKRVTKKQPKMWGPSIVGYGSYTYRYESGHSGDASLTGFAVRGKELVVYIIAENPEQVDLLAKLGRHKMGKVCRRSQAPPGPRCRGPGGAHCRVGRRSQTPIPGPQRRLTPRSSGPATACLRGRRGKTRESFNVVRDGIHDPEGVDRWGRPQLGRPRSPGSVGRQRRKRPPP